jgi:hypothetical protein
MSFRQLFSSYFKYVEKLLKQRSYEKFVRINVDEIDGWQDAAANLVFWQT